RESDVWAGCWTWALGFSWINGSKPAIVPFWGVRVICRGGNTPLYSEPQAFLNTPIARRMKISNTAPPMAMMKRMMAPPSSKPSSPAIQKPSTEPMMPTMMLAISPICSLVFMMMLASKPTIPPMIRVIIQPMVLPLVVTKCTDQSSSRSARLPVKDFLYWSIPWADKAKGAMKYIFEVHIKDGHTAEEYADAWVRASEIIQRAPGARGTELHRKIGDPRTLIAIASWDSKEQRDAM